MLGLINCSKSWPQRPGLGEILLLTPDLWQSGAGACGSQHGMHVTSLCAKLTASEPPSVSEWFI